MSNKAVYSNGSYYSRTTQSTTSDGRSKSSSTLSECSNSESELSSSNTSPQLLSKRQNQWETSLNHSPPPQNRFQDLSNLPYPELDRDFPASPTLELYLRNDTHTVVGYSTSYISSLIYTTGFPEDPKAQSQIDEELVAEAEARAWRTIGDFEKQMARRDAPSYNEHPTFNCNINLKSNLVNTDSCPSILNFENLRHTLISSAALT